MTRWRTSRHLKCVLQLDVGFAISRSARASGDRFQDGSVVTKVESATRVIDMSRMPWHAVFLSFLALLTVFGALSGRKEKRAASIDRTTMPIDPEQDAIERFRQMTYDQQFKYLGRLANERDLSTLLVLCRTETNGQAFAIEETIPLLPATQALDLTKSYPSGSCEWAYALLSLRSQPKQDVIPYLYSVMADATPAERYFCYRLCLRQKWPELLSWAANDVDDATFVPFTNQPYDQTLGRIARDYCKLVANPGSNTSSSPKTSSVRRNQGRSENRLR